MWEWETWREWHNEDIANNTYEGGAHMEKRTRGNTVEFPKDFYERLKRVALIERKPIGEFARKLLEERISEIEENYAKGIFANKQQEYLYLIMKADEEVE